MPSRRARLAMAALCGVALTLAQPPLSIWPLVLVAVRVLVWLVARAPSPTAAGWTGFVAATSFFATGLYWIVEAFLVDIARHGWMAPFALALLSAGLALFWVPAFWLTGRLRRAGLASGPVSVALFLAGMLTLMEYGRTHLLTGFPWALPAYAWVETPLAQLAALAGPHMLGFVTLLAAGALAALPHRGGGRVVALAGLVLLAAGWGWGSWRLDQPVPDRADGLVVRVVQPNAAQHEKWQPSLFETFLQRQLAATAAAPSGTAPPDVVIWPETALPWFVDAEPELRAQIAAAANDAEVILGARRVVNGAWYNTLLVLGPGGKVLSVYDKHHLVPFGEYIPLHGLLGRMGLGSLTGGRFTPGSGPRVLAAPGVPAFLALICYEAIFPHQMQAATRPDWLVQITNDAWFGTSAGPYQHFAQARMRAIEQGLPLARAANTGISGIIGPMGRVIASKPLLTEGHVDAVLPAPLRPTLYATTGDTPWILFILAVLVTGVTVRLRNSSLNPRRSFSKS
ncbi:MAG: apolipoprotein N-acyltransferase [Pseudomonadota bacterium]